MSLARWDPLLQLGNIENEMDRLFRRQFAGASREEEAVTSAEFSPPVDVYEDENRLALKIEVPGIDPKDSDIRVEGNMLTVRGKRKLETDEKKENFRRIERTYDAFSRSFTLPPSADMDRVKANFEAGVLEIDIRDFVNSPQLYP